MPSIIPGRAARKINRIGVLTAGGDCPGLNAVIRAVVKSAVLTYGWEVVGIRDGFEGLIGEDDALEPLTIDSVHGILARGGTILGAASRANPFLYTKRQQGNRVEIDVTPRVLERIEELALDAVVVIGGDGTMRIARELHEMGAPLVGVPKTIDNDVDGTEYTFGFDTAVSVATEAIDRLRTTAESHHRAMIVEVMGRQAGWIALHSGVAGGADVVLIPEFPFDLEVIYRRRNAVLLRCSARPSLWWQKAPMRRAAARSSVAGQAARTSSGWAASANTWRNCCKSARSRNWPAPPSSTTTSASPCSATCSAAARPATPTACWLPDLAQPLCD